MRILIVMGGFFPAQKYGGPPVSINNICNLLKREFDFYIVASNHDLGSQEPLMGIKSGWNKRNNAKVMYLPDGKINKRTYEEIIDQVKPDCIYLNSLFNAKIVVPILRIARKKKIKVILAPRGEINHQAFSKKYKKLPYIWLMMPLLNNKRTKIQSTCAEETECIKKWIRVSDDRILKLDNIPSIPQQQYPAVVKENGRLRIVFFSRIVPKKNLRFALECLKEIKQGIIELDIYGPIENESYWDECKSVIDTLGENITVSYKGTIGHEEVFDTISKYHLFFFPTHSENYGHVIAEALFSGVPTLISDQTPWNDINSTKAGKAIALCNRFEFVDYIQTMISLNNAEYSEMSDAAYRFALKKSRIQTIADEYIGGFKN